MKEKSKHWDHPREPAVVEVRYWKLLKEALEHPAERWSKPDGFPPINGRLLESRLKEALPN